MTTLVSRMARLLVYAALLAAALAPSAHAKSAAATASKLESIMRSAGPYSGALAVDLDSGRILMSVRPDTARIPASVEKLFVTASALRRFGPDGALPTRVLSRVQPDEFGVIDGNVYLRGAGDPTLGRKRMDQLASDLLAAGVSEVTGRIVGDESAWDSRRGPEGWGVDGWVGPLSALVYGRGRVGRGWIAKPPLGAAKAFRSALRRAGIYADRKPRVGRTPEDAAVIAEAFSPSMSRLVRTTNVYSDNFTAEMLMKALGSEFGSAGSTKVGARIVRRDMKRYGLRPRVVDGSGLSRSNRTSPRHVVTLLEELDGDRDFWRSLAVAGRTGTLHDRLRRSVAKGRCRGKTGTINGVSNLAGYCLSRAGGRTAFAFLMNGVNVYSARRLQDRMASLLARYRP